VDTSDRSLEKERRLKQPPPKIMRTSRSFPKNSRFFR
jgi:hypothetical protein